MGFGKVMRPYIQFMQNEFESNSPGDDCKVHKYYQCLVDNGIQDTPWREDETTCKKDNNCESKIHGSDFTPEADTEYHDGQDELRDKMEERANDLFEPIGQSMQKAYIENAANVAKVQQGLGPSLKNILTNYGCDAACLDSVPLDVVTIAQATTYCSCPAVVEVSQTMPGRSMDVTKVLVEMGIPETIQKKPETANMNLVSSPDVVVPQTNYI